MRLFDPVRQDSLVSNLCDYLLRIAFSWSVKALNSWFMQKHLTKLRRMKDQNKPSWVAELGSFWLITAPGCSTHLRCNPAVWQCRQKTQRTQLWYAISVRAYYKSPSVSCKVATTACVGRRRSKSKSGGQRARRDIDIYLSATSAENTLCNKKGKKPAPTIMAMGCSVWVQNGCCVISCPRIPRSSRAAAKSARLLVC